MQINILEHCDSEKHVGSKCLTYYQLLVLFWVNKPSYWHPLEPRVSYFQKFLGALPWGLTVWGSIVKQEPEGLSRCWVPCACSPIMPHTIRVIVLGTWFCHGLCRLWNLQKEKLFQRVTEMLWKYFAGIFLFKSMYGDINFFVSDLFNRWWQLVENYIL